MILASILRFLEAPFKFLFGDDVFISYSREDGISYAEGLGSELAQRDFSCRIDLWETSPGNQLPPKLRRQIRWSRLLVLVATERAASSSHVELEIAEFLKAGGPIVPIAFPRILESAIWYPRVAGLPWAKETSTGALVIGRPSEAVVSRIQNSAKFTLRSHRIRRVFVSSLVAFLVLLALSIVAAFQARRAHEEALEQGAISFSRQLAGHATAQLGHRYDLSLLLAAKAYGAHPTFEARRSLLEALLDQPHLITMLRAGDSAVSSLALSPNGKLLAAGNGDGSVVFWDLTSLRQLNCPEVPERSEAVTSLAFSTDGQILVSQDDGGIISLWNVQTQRRLSELDASGGMLSIETGLALTRASRLLALGGYDTLGVWDVTDPSNPGPLTFANGSVRSIASSPDGTRVAIVFGNEVGFVDAAVTKQVGQILKSDGPIELIAFSPRPGSTLLAMVSSGHLLLWDYSTGKLVKTPQEEGERYQSIAFSTDGRVLAAVRHEGRIVLWHVPDLNRDYDSFRDEKQLAHYRQGATSVIFAGDRLLSGHEDGSIAVWELPILDGLPLYNNSFEPFWTRAALHLGKDLPMSEVANLRAVNADDSVQDLLWKSDILGDTKPFGSFRDGHRGLLVTQNDRGILALWDITSPKRPVFLASQYQGSPWCAAFRRDGGALVTAGSEGVVLWDLAASEATVRYLDRHEHRLNSLLFGQDGTSMLGLDERGRIVVWDLSRRPARTQTFSAGVRRIDPVHAILSPDGTTLAIVHRSTGERPDIVLWDMSARSPLAILPVDHYDDIAFSRDSQKLLLLSGQKATALEIGSSLPALACREAHRELTLEERSRYLGEQPDDPYPCRFPRPSCPDL